MNRHPSLQRIVRSRLLPWMALPLALLLLGLTVVQVRSKLEAVREQDRLMTASLAHYVQMYLDGAISALGYLNRLHGLSAGSATMAAAVQSLQSDLRFTRVLLLDKNGVVSEAYPAGRPGLDFPLYFPEAGAAANVISQPLYSAESGNMTIFLRHRGAAGNSVVGELDLGHLQVYMDRFTPDETPSLSILTDGYGNVISHPDQVRVRQQANLGGMPLLRDLNGRPGSFSFFLFENQPWLGSVQVIPGLDWRVIILKPAFAALRPIIIFAAVLLAVSLSYLGFLVWLIQRRLRRHIEQPVSHLTQAIQNMARGDYAELEPGPQDFLELTVMAGEFRSMARTVAEREEALRLSREKYRSIFENAAEGIIQVTAGGSLLSANPAAARMFGFDTPDDAIGHYTDLAGQLFMDPADRAALLMRLDKEGASFQQLRIRRRDGEERWIEAHSRGAKDDAGNIVFVESILHDVTERRAAEERLRASLQEKDVLLKEVHHRVKNNLQIISSLLYLQALSSDDTATQALFFESQGRIATMSLVHEELYRSADFSRIDLREYAGKLMQRLLQSFGTPGVRLELRTVSLPLPMQAAIPCGLILNELVTNAIKHAFRNREDGLLRLSIRDAGERGLLVLEDNGPGLTPDFDPQRSETLGMQLVTRLTAQIRGTFVIGRSEMGGARFELTFPLGEADPPAPA